MRRLALLCFALAGLSLHAQDSGAALEQQVADIAAGSHVTIVHFWAPWCPNCKAEMGPDGWAKFIAANPEVKFVFLNVWHKGQDPLPKLAAAGLGAQPNLLLLTHPNPSRKEADRLNSLLGLPVTWLPTTWVFKEGRLRFAFNYGEVRFPLLQQMIDDAREKWSHD
jgi:thiol-disulfide isomerase/thioredoxin